MKPMWIEIKASPCHSSFCPWCKMFLSCDTTTPEGSVFWKRKKKEQNNKIGRVLEGLLVQPPAQAGNPVPFLTNGPPISSLKSSSVVVSTTSGGNALVKHSWNPCCPESLAAVDLICGLLLLTVYWGSKWGFRLQ